MLTKFQFWLLKWLPALRSRLESLEETNSSLQKTLDTFNGYEARHAKRIAEQEKKHKAQMKTLRKELVALIDGSDPSPDVKWLELGIKRVILRDIFGDAGPGTIYTAERMAERIQNGEVSLKYFSGAERAQIHDLLLSEHGRQMFNQFAGKVVQGLGNNLEIYSYKYKDVAFDSYSFQVRVKPYATAITISSLLLY